MRCTLRSFVELFGHVTVHMNSNMVDCGERVNGRYRRVEETEVVLPMVMPSEIMVCGGRRQRWKVVVLFTDHDESFNGGYLRVEEAEVVLLMVVSS